MNEYLNVFIVLYILWSCCPLQVVGGAAAEGKGVPTGPEDHAAAENKRPGACQSQTQTSG